MCLPCRPLLDCPDLLTLPAAMESMRCCLLIVEPASAAISQRAISSAGASSSSPVSSSYAITYANAAAVQLLLGRKAGDTQQLAAFQAGPAGSGRPVAALESLTSGWPSDVPLSAVLPCPTAEMLQVGSIRMGSPRCNDPEKDPCRIPT